MIYFTNLFDPSLETQGEGVNFGIKVLEVFKSFLPYFNMFVYPVCALSILIGIFLVFLRHENRKMRRNAIVFCIIGLPVLLIGIRLFLGLLITYLL